MLTSLGEGHGFSVVESMACGVPCVTGNYGGSVELVPNHLWLVEPISERLDTLHNCIRPVYSPVDFAARIEDVLNDPALRNPEMCRNAVAFLDWKALWPSTWVKFFLDGIR